MCTGGVYIWGKVDQTKGMAMGMPVETKEGCLNCGGALREGTLCECVDSPRLGQPLYVCAACSPTAILSTENLNHMYGEIVSALHHATDDDSRLIVNPPPIVSLVGASEVRRVSGDERTIGLYVHDPAYPQIMVARGYEYWKTFAILAHEYGHAWQGAYVPGYQMMDAGIIEGFAEWLAAKALSGAGRPNIRVSPAHVTSDDVYIHGLALFQTMEEQQGINGVLTLAATGNISQAASALGYERMVTARQSKGKSRPH